MSDSIRAMIQAEADAFAQDRVDFLRSILWKAFVDDISAERQRQVRFAFPPCAQVEQLHESFRSKCELSFMNDQADICVSLRDE